MSYEEFLATKSRVAPDAGFEAGELNPMLFPFQADIVRWALRRGRAAIFADTGLGKTIMQLEWARHVVAHTGSPVLLLAPLAVSEQTRREGDRFGIPARVVKSGDEVEIGINITNYERLHRFDPAGLSGVVLDESSILKQFSGAIRGQIQRTFARTPFKLACTATPAPNDHMEIGTHSEFLDAMPSSEMLARYFINDTMSFGTYRLKRHAVRDFWSWVSTWAVAVAAPSDLGYDDGKFLLPELHEERHEVRVDCRPRDGDLFPMPAMSATEVHKEMRRTAPARAAEVARLIEEEPEEFWLVWCHTNYEADELLERIDGAVEIRGSESTEAKARKLLAFSDGEIRRLVTKPSIAGFGMNWQHCARMAFVGLSYSYESYYQALRRCWRFGQERPVHAHVVCADTESVVYDSVAAKAERHTEMKDNMRENMDAKLIVRGDLELTDTPETDVVETPTWRLELGDACELAKPMEAGKVDFTIFSPPFSSLYIYSDSSRDMGNCADDEEFFDHFRFLIPEILRVTRPGRLCAVHCKQLVYYANQRGSAGLRDFRGDIIRAFVDSGWDYHSEVTIWKDPVTEMQRTKAHGLLHKQLCKDSTFSRQGLPDYLVIFRKWAREGDTASPVNSENERVRFTDYVGEKGPERVESARDASIQVWQRYASPVWFDINPMNVLNVRQARENRDEKHICPLQLDVIRRALRLWTNRGDLVFSPFSGIGSEGHVAIEEGRRFVGFELKRAYFDQAIRNLRAAAERGQQSLFGGGVMDYRPLDEGTWLTYSEPIRAELEKALARFPAFHSMHEGYATLFEEVDELWDLVKLKQGHWDRKPMARHECVQIAAMAIRFAMDCCDRKCADE